MTEQREPSRIDLDLGDGHTLRWMEWNPDPALNPQYADLPPEEFHHGAIVSHFTDETETGYCEGGITFDSPRARRAWTDHPMWTVESRDPLTLCPSLLCSCGDHGFIRDGRWVRA